MIGDVVSTEKVIADLERVRIGLCAYLADEHHTCDCKFLKDGQLPRRGSEQTGCCEIRQAVHHLRELSKGTQPWPRDRVAAILRYAQRNLDEAAQQIEDLA